MAAPTDAPTPTTRSAVTPVTEGSPSRAESWAVLAAILLAFIVLATGYNLLVPPYEAPDELSHIHYVHFVASEGREPGRWRTEDGQWHLETWEAVQPPMYYWLVAGLLRAAGHPRLMPVGASLNPGSGHTIFADPDQILPDSYSAREAAWTHLVRLFSTILGAVTVALTFLAARIAFPDRWAVAPMAAVFVAANPRFLHLSASVTNDTLATVWVAALTVVTMWVATRRARRITAIVLGAAIALGLWTKLSVLPVAAVAALALVWDPLRPIRGVEPLAARLRNAAWMTAVAAVGYLPILWFRSDRTWTDPLGIRSTYEAHQMLQSNRSLGSLLFDPRFIANSYHTFWAEFGALVARVPGWGQQVYVGVGLIGIVGCAVLAWRRRHGLPVLAVGTLIIGLTCASYLQHNARVWAVQGRLLFPALPAVAILLAIGWVTLARTARRALPERTDADVGTSQTLLSVRTDQRSSITVAVLLAVGLFALNLVWLRTPVARTWHMRGEDHLLADIPARHAELTLCCGEELVQTAHVVGLLSRVDLALSRAEPDAAHGAFELLVVPEGRPDLRRRVVRTVEDVRHVGVQRFEFAPLRIDGPVHLVLRTGQQLVPGIDVGYVADPSHYGQGVLRHEGRSVQGDLRFRLYFRD